MNGAGQAIVIRNLTKYYRGNPKAALDHVSLSIGEGQFFGLLGPNGAGKTTMIRILCGLLAPTEGDVTIGGCSLKDGMACIRRVIGVVPQDIALYPSLTARENLTVFGGMSGMKGRALRQRTQELLESYGLDKSARIRVSEFSGGMKRRLNLAAGLLHNPAILFLDEPTVGIDVHSRKVITASLTAINRLGTTVVYTSHYLEEAESLCSHVAIIDEGKIISRGSMAEITTAAGGKLRLEDVFLELTGKSLRD